MSNRLYEIYTDEETEFIKNNRSSMTIKEIALALNRTYEGIRYKLKKLKINVNNKWDENLINDMCSAKTVDDCIMLCDKYNLKFSSIIDIRNRNKIKNFRVFNIYYNMTSRCNRVKSDSYYNYGARDIKVCDEWNGNFREFYNWAKNNGYTDDLTLDRIDNNGNYCPENCRWVTMHEQTRNKRDNVFMSAFGETKVVADWAKDPRCDVSITTIYHRLRSDKFKGLTGESILSKNKGNV